jgi:hypothetical protein
VAKLKRIARSLLRTSKHKPKGLSNNQARNIKESNEIELCRFELRKLYLNEVNAQCTDFELDIFSETEMKIVIAVALYNRSKNDYKSLSALIKKISLIVRLSPSTIRQNCYEKRKE